MASIGTPDWASGGTGPPPFSAPFRPTQVRTSRQETRRATGFGPPPLVSWSRRCLRSHSRPGRGVRWRRMPVKGVWVGSGVNELACVRIWGRAFAPWCFVRRREEEEAWARGEGNSPLSAGARPRLPKRGSTNSGLWRRCQSWHAATQRACHGLPMWGPGPKVLVLRSACLSLLPFVGARGRERGRVLPNRENSAPRGDPRGTDPGHAPPFESSRPVGDLSNQGVTNVCKMGGEIAASRHSKRAPLQTQVAFFLLLGREAEAEARCARREAHSREASATSVPTCPQMAARI